MKEEYIFESHWTHATTPPHSGTRCIVTDGDVVLFGTYVCNHESNGTWIIPEVHSSEPLNIIGWMPSPKPMKKTVPYVEKTMEKSS